MTACLASGEFQSIRSSRSSADGRISSIRPAARPIDDFWSSYYADGGIFFSTGCTAIAVNNISRVARPAVSAAPQQKSSRHP